MQNIKINYLFKILFVSLVVVLAFSACNLRSSDVKGQTELLTPQKEGSAVVSDVDNSERACNPCCNFKENGMWPEGRWEYFQNLAALGYLNPTLIGQKLNEGCIDQGDAEDLLVLYNTKPTTSFQTDLISAVVPPVANRCCEQYDANVGVCQAVVNVNTLGGKNKEITSAIFADLLLKGCVELIVPPREITTPTPCVEVHGFTTTSPLQVFDEAYYAQMMSNKDKSFCATLPFDYIKENQDGTLSILEIGNSTLISIRQCLSKAFYSSLINYCTQQP